jgi:transcriptional regulator GlxA family with amidase domain
MAKRKTETRRRKAGKWNAEVFSGPCTTHSASKADLAAQGGKVINARVVDDGDLITSGGITSGLDLGLWLVTRELGADIGIQVEAAMEYEQRGVVWRRS